MTLVLQLFCALEGQNCKFVQPARQQAITACLEAICSCGFARLGEVARPDAAPWPKGSTMCSVHSVLGIKYG